MERVDEYNQMIDDVYGDVTIGDISWPASHVLKELDPIAYEVGYTDWLDTVEEDEKLFPEYGEDD